MSRSLVLGNGNIFISLDHSGQMRELYFPYVGLENHTPNCIHKIGVWVDGQYSWVDAPGWSVEIRYEHETLASKIKAVNTDLELELHFSDIVYNESNIFLRNITVMNKAGHERTIKIFFNQQFQIKENQKGNTAYYDPNESAIIHYKGRRVFLVGGRTGGKNGKPFNDYSVGHFNALGKEGTWKDAEDGVLSKNAIEHGAVDSVIGFSETVKGKKSFTINYWMAIAETIKDAKELQAYILEKTPDHLLKTTKDFWHAWANKSPLHFRDLSSGSVDLFKRSLLIIRAHADNRGGIIASGDTGTVQFGLDTYAYVWPRDAAVSVMALDKSGYSEITRTFFEFANDVVSDDGYFYHKYSVDESMGSSWHPWIKDGVPLLPIQEDETAFILYALWNHYECSGSLEFVERIYNSLIKKSADFLVSFRDDTTKLPHPSYDLWEERYGISTFTSCAVYGALRAASNFAHLLMKEDDEARFTKNAEELKQAILEHLYNKETGTFHKLLEKNKDGVLVPDPTTDISSFYGLFHFGVLRFDDERLSAFFNTVKKELTCCERNVGGLARYKGDRYYHEGGEEVPGNPWVITAMWIAQYYIAVAREEKDMDIVREYLDWAVRIAQPSGVLSEQLNAHTEEQISVAPLTWSHAEFVQTVLQYLKKLKQLSVSEPNNTFSPRPKQ